MNGSIVAVVVTHNRKDLLQRCLTGLEVQTRRPDRILIVDNASSDGTGEFLSNAGWTRRSNVSVLQLPENTGGSGGFSAGLRRAVDDGADWVWMMDDDAVPEAGALEHLDRISLNPDSLYGSVALSGGDLSWPMELVRSPGSQAIENADEIEGMVEVRFLPFLGLLVSRTLVDRIGLPDAGFFVSADDVEYCLRARAEGASIFLVPGSRIEHPASSRYRVMLGGRSRHFWKVPSWKRYYEVRNRIIVAKRHHGAALYYQTIPASLLRLAVTLTFESDKLNQARAYIAGMLDGLLGRMGRRHERWGLRR